jgi:hypothetical protein
MLRPLGPRGGTQGPPLREVLSGGSNPRVDKCIADRLGDGIEAPLLRSLVRMIKVKLIHEFIEGKSEISFPLPCVPGNIRECLRAGHSSLTNSTAT